VIFGSPLIGKITRFTGRRNLIVFGMALMGVSYIFFGMISD